MPGSAEDDYGNKERRAVKCCTTGIIVVAGRGQKLMLTDSLGKYTKVPGAKVKAYPGEILTRLADRIRFEGVDVSRVSCILVHVGTNDISNLLDSGRIKHTTPQELLRRFSTLRSVIRRRNSRAVIIFSSVLPRLRKFETYKPYAAGLNFCLEKWCLEGRVFTSRHIGTSWRVEGLCPSCLPRMGCIWMVQGWTAWRPASSRLCPLLIWWIGWLQGEQDDWPS